MKKILATIAVVALAVPVFASAAVSCGQIDPNTGNTVQCGNGNPEMVVGAWGLTNSQLPHIQPGQSKTNRWGELVLCPAWFTNYCVDISDTPYYIALHR